MMLNTSRFGELEIQEGDIITFKEGLPGLNSLKRFFIISPDKDIPFKWLQSIDDTDIALIVIDPYLYFSDYDFTIDDDTIKELEIEKAEDVGVFTVAVIPQDIKKMTANFVAPIIVNTRNMIGKQIILMSSDYQVRTPIYEMYLNVKTQEAV